MKITVFRNTVMKPSLKFYLDITIILRDEQNAMRKNDRLLIAMNEIFFPESLVSLLIAAAITMLITIASSNEWQIIL